MKPTTYALIVALTVGAAPLLSATAQQETGRHTSKPSLNAVPVALAPVRVSAAAPEKMPVARAGATVNDVPVQLPAVHIVATRNAAQHPQQVQKTDVAPQVIVVLRVAISGILDDAAAK